LFWYRAEHRREYYLILKVPVGTILNILVIEDDQAVAAELVESAPLIEGSDPIDGNRALSGGIVTFRRLHGITSAIEGIEHSEHLAIAGISGADCSHGYYWGRPTVKAGTLQ
jgi:hypothetical protein